MKTVALISKAQTSPQHTDLIRHVLAEAGAIFVADDVSQADLVISVGGDGTFLHAAKAVGSSGTPILGINTGHLGFLAETSPEDIAPVLQQVLRGEYQVHPRSVIEVLTEGEHLHDYPYALNEVAILKHDNSSLIQIETYVDGSLLNGYLADGLIIATPTGSTGYSLSVGGPIVTPNSGCLCLSAVAPHSLNVRPVIVRDDVEITLRIHSRTGSYLLAIDGRSQSLNDTTTLRLRRAPYTINEARVLQKDFFETLREKMNWGIDPR